MNFIGRSFHAPRRFDNVRHVAAQRQGANTDLRLISYRLALASQTMAPGHRQQERSMGKQRSGGKESMNLIERLSGKSPDVLTAAAADDLLAISGLAQTEVERVVAEAYRRRGYQVVALASSGAQPDAGLLLTKATQRLLLQCKYWNTRKIAEMPVRELYGMMAAHNANAGMLITSGSFTLEASRFAGYGSIQLIDGPRLLALLRDNEAAQQSEGQTARASSAAR
jgi:restriction endonuclease Mrr